MACGILVCQLGIKTEVLAGRLPNLKSGLPENPQEILNLKTHFTCVHWTIFLRKIFTPFPTSSNHYNKHSQSTYYLPGFNPHDKHLRSGSTRNRPLGKRVKSLSELEWFPKVPARGVGKWDEEERKVIKGVTAQVTTQDNGLNPTKNSGSQCRPCLRVTSTQGRGCYLLGTSACLAHRPVDSCH